MPGVPKEKQVTTDGWGSDMTGAKPFPDGAGAEVPDVTRAEVPDVAGAGFPDVAGAGLGRVSSCGVLPGLDRGSKGGGRTSALLLGRQGGLSHVFAFAVAQHLHSCLAPLRAASSGVRPEPCTSERCTCADICMG